MVKFGKATVVERSDITAELAVFRLAPANKLDFLPGQFATLALESEGKRLPRAYSLVSAPHESLLEFFVELVPTGELTPRLWDLQAGDELLIREQAAGAFLLNRKLGLKRHLLLATVTGVAPFISMLRAHAQQMKQGQSLEDQFVLIHGASHAPDFGPYRDELTILAKQGWLTYLPTISRPWDEPAWTGEVGRVDDLLRKYADQFGYDYSNAVAYACGHPLMVEAARGILQRARFPRAQIRAEKYFTINDPK